MPLWSRWHWRGSDQVEIALATHPLGGFRTVVFQWSPRDPGSVNTLSSTADEPFQERSQQPCRSVVFLPSRCGCAAPPPAPPGSVARDLSTAPTMGIFYTLMHSPALIYVRFVLSSWGLSLIASVAANHCDHCLPPACALLPCRPRPRLFPASAPPPTYSPPLLSHSLQFFPFCSVFCCFC